MIDRLRGYYRINRIIYVNAGWASVAGRRGWGARGRRVDGVGFGRRVLCNKELDGQLDAPATNLTGAADPDSSVSEDKFGFAQYASADIRFGAGFCR